jgi:hypothetical protein
MTMDVPQAFLNDPENGSFQIGRQSAKGTIAFQADRGSASFTELFHVPTQRRRQASFIKKRGMQKM